ncbi:hypothetical protein G7Y89_g12761 [Cudoniella acicularis]|uniref:Uncharacterized protein n=1 Tax=Cudoniella acicularis TaxID=354080 RepID=A0A8H4RAT5_9HELO|nr:hypothetical protein G7Y89_g12761 [Cudoniella acicularis]
MAEAASLDVGSPKISNAAAACAGTFHALLTSDALPSYDSGWTEDQMARFNIWASNLGVFAQGHTSADHRLQGFDDVRSLMFQFLKALLENLICTTGTPTPHETVNDESRADNKGSDGHPPSSSTPSFTFSSMSSSKESSGGSIPTPVAKARVEVEDAISRLNRLSASIRKSGTQARDLKAAPFIDQDYDGNDLTAFYSRLSSLIVDQKFPKANEEIRQRLARSLSRRRNQLAYRRRHQQKSEQANASLDATTRSVPHDLKTPTQIDVKRPLLSNMSAPVLDPKGLLNRAGSTISGAHSTAMLCSPSRVPNFNFLSAPKVNETGFFECPYCLILCPVEEARGKSWKHHVMKDLAPYLCLSNECDKPDEPFQTFSDWIAHIRNEHATLHWECLAPIHEPASFADQNLYMDHMRRFHSGSFADSQLPALAQMSARVESRIFSICPLCDHLPEGFVQERPDQHQQEDQNALQKHIAQHLQSMALISFSWLGDLKSEMSSKIESDLAFEDETGILIFHDPPDRAVQVDSYLDPDWNGICPAPSSIELDEVWQDFTGTSQDTARALEWWFVTKSKNLTFDHTQDEKLAPFVKAYMLSDVARPKVPAGFESKDKNYQRQHEPLQLHRVHCQGQVFVYSDAPIWQPIWRPDDIHTTNTPPEHLAGNQVYKEALFGYDFIAGHDYKCDCLSKAPLAGPHLTKSAPVSREFIKLLSQELCDALINLKIDGKEFQLGQEIDSPYLFFYHGREYIESHIKASTADISSLKGFLDYIYLHVGAEYEEADRCFSSGVVVSRFMPYLFFPDTILVSNDKSGARDVEAFRQTTEIRSFADNDSKLVWEIDMEYVILENSTLIPRTTTFTISCDSSDGATEITSLDVFPLKFAKPGIEDHLLAQRNETKELFMSSSIVTIRDVTIALEGGLKFQRTGRIADNPTNPTSGTGPERERRLPLNAKGGFLSTGACDPSSVVFTDNLTLTYTDPICGAQGYSDPLFSAWKKGQVTRISLKLEESDE